jgi:predicted alpha/beta hydrolase family esterase
MALSTLKNISLITIMHTDILVLPGWQNSLEQHWQSLWESQHPGWRRIQQRDWDFPLAQDWLVQIESQVRECARPPVIVAHSLGCIAVTNWARDSQTALAGAFLVAPPDLERDDAPAALRNFLPVQRARLRFPALVVASENDPFSGYARSQQLALDWGAAFHGVGALGHINTDSGIQNWPAGQSLLQDFLASLG